MSGGRSATQGYVLKNAVREILKGIGEDPDRQGLLDTPERVEKAMKFLTSGYNVDIDELIGSALFDEEYNEMVLVKDIDVYSLCEHHMLPFFGKAHVGYIPDGKIVGLSKLPRLVDAFSRRLQVQERLTMQIADTLTEYVKPKGVAVVIEANHMCMAMRGVEHKSSYTVTSSMTGAFQKHQKTREEFLQLIKHKM